MSGFLPDTRPLGESYFPDLIDDRPLEDPERELPADGLNKLKADAAYAARMTPLLKVQVSNDGVTATVVSATGPEGVDTADVIVTRTGAGLFTANWSATGIAGTEVTGTGRHVSTVGVVLATIPVNGIASLALVSDAGPLDSDLTFWVW